MKLKEQSWSETELVMLGKFGKIVNWGGNEVKFGKVVKWGGMKYETREGMKEEDRRELFVYEREWKEKGELQKLDVIQAGTATRANRYET